jgi:hypothetical protein
MRKQDRPVLLTAPAYETNRPALGASLGEEKVHHVGNGVNQRYVNGFIVRSSQLGSLPTQVPNLILERIESADDGGR